MRLATRSGDDYEPGLRILCEVVKARAPEGDWERLFGGDEQVERLARMSGGHIRQLLLAVRETIIRTTTLPASPETIEAAIRQLRRAFGVLADDQVEWLRQLAANEGGRTERLAARSPDELAGFATTVGVDPTDTLVWVCVEQGALGTTDEWATAWRGLLAGLNRRREEIGRNLHDGLVIAGPAGHHDGGARSLRTCLVETGGVHTFAAQAPDDASSGRAGGEPGTGTDAQAGTEPDWRAWLAASENAAGDPTNPASPVFDEGFATSVRDLEQAIRQGDDRLVWAHDTANTLYEQPRRRRHEACPASVAAFVADDGRRRSVRPSGANAAHRCAERRAQRPVDG
ncbi:MAG: hypothetical protein IPG46_18160 [Actinobacteria bacterium]|nr:hypothetical protein [Actinomycetota bacterium]